MIHSGVRSAGAGRRGITRRAEWTSERCNDRVWTSCCPDRSVRGPTQVQVSNVWTFVCPAVHINHRLRATLPTKIPDILQVRTWGHRWHSGDCPQKGPQRRRLPNCMSPQGYLCQFQRNRCTNAQLQIRACFQRSGEALIPTGSLHTANSLAVCSRRRQDASPGPHPQHEPPDARLAMETLVQFFAVTRYGCLLTGTYGFAMISSVVYPACNIC